MNIRHCIKSVDLIRRTGLSRGGGGVLSIVKFQFTSQTSTKQRKRFYFHSPYKQKTKQNNKTPYKHSFNNNLSRSILSFKISNCLLMQLAICLFNFILNQYAHQKVMISNMRVDKASQTRKFVALCLIFLTFKYF